MNHIEVIRQALVTLEEIHPGNMGPMAEEAWNKAIAALRQVIEEIERDHTYGYAKELAEAIFKQHFAKDEHYASGRIVWGVNDTVIGILTQIDNMVSGMVRKPRPAEEKYGRLHQKELK